MSTVSANAAIEAAWAKAKASGDNTEREAGFAAYRAAKASLAAEAAAAAAAKASVALAVPNTNKKESTTMTQTTTTNVTDIATILANPALATALAAAIRAIGGSIPAAQVAPQPRIAWAEDGSDDMLRSWLSMLTTPEYADEVAIPEVNDPKGFITKYADSVRNRDDGLLTTKQLRLARQKMVWLSDYQRDLIEMEGRSTWKVPAASEVPAAPEG